ncbi:MAG: prenyltransferase [Candidatus Aminicenantes bacterium]|nr:prenyltransferase [Candidatus Aminicenantes bacterium]
MKKQSKITVWFRQIRGPFLVLSVVLVLIGIAAAGRDGYNPRWFDAVLLITGVVLAHISVNLFNELSDYKTKIDEHTLPTPFSGGSGMMQAGLTNPKKVTGVAYTALILAGFIGLYFCVAGSWVILVFIICGGVAVRFYTSHLARWLLGEFFSGLTLGTFVILGSYMALTGRLNIDILFISIPPGLLTFLLLFLNEFPDAEADRKGGRYHLVIRFGKKKSAIIYIAVLIVIYILILTAPFILNIPITVLLALLTLPIASAAAVKIVKFHSNTPKLVPALAMNIMVVILTDLLLAIGYFI